MFWVQEIETGKVLRVYAVMGIRFLLWSECDQCWMSGEMNRYRPYERMNRNG